MMYFEIKTCFFRAFFSLELDSIDACNDDNGLLRDVSILPGVNIGNNVIIGAGSIVTKNIPDNCIAYGIPCKKKKDIFNTSIK